MAPSCLGVESLAPNHAAVNSNAMLIPRIEHPELVFGFVAPIGASLDSAVGAFRDFFRRQGYRVVDIKVTDAFKVLKPHVAPKRQLKTHPPEARYRSYIAYGDQLRDHFGDDSILAAISICRIIRERERQLSESKYSNIVFLLHQFKRREEIELLRAVYGEIFFQVSVYSRRGARVDNLAHTFGDSSANANAFRSAAEDLVQMDENEAAAHGQQVSKIFHDADFIVNLDHNEPDFSEQIYRFCQLMYGSNSLSPTRMEHGVFLAKGAALRSLDLSRQVGACILNRTGQVIALGANEVPKAGGGTYWTEGPFDDRDYRRKVDSNDQRKRAILLELLTALGSRKNIDEVLLNPKVKNSRLMDALEYSRVIHAEMNAVCDAARAGQSLQDAILYCTTFPCHMCAKHIIAAGVAQVVFLEPYPKSLAAELNSDSLQIEGADRGPYQTFPAVQFLHFFGVTPRRYRELFERARRKDDEGQFLEYVHNPKRPIVDIKSPTYAQSESIVLRSVKRIFLDKLDVDDSILKGV